MKRLCYSEGVQGRVPAVTKMSLAGELPLRLFDRDGSTGNAVAATHLVVGNPSRSLFDRQDLNRVTLAKSSERRKCEGAGAEDYHLPQSAVVLRLTAGRMQSARIDKARFGNRWPRHTTVEAIPGSGGRERFGQCPTLICVRVGYCSLKPFQRAHTYQNRRRRNDNGINKEATQ